MLHSNPSNAILPLPEIWHTNLLPYFLAGPGDLTVTRAKLRQVSRSQYQWDRAFLPPHKWRDIYVQSGRIEPIAYLLQLLAFVGWSVLPPPEYWEPVSVRFALTRGRCPLHPVEARTARFKPVSSTPTFVHGDFGSRTFDTFSLYVKLGMTDRCPMDHAGVTVSVAEPDPHDPDCIRMEDVEYDVPLSGGRGAFALRRFQCAIQLANEFNLAALDGALMLAYGRGLPRIGTPVFFDEEDDDYEEGEEEGDDADQPGVREDGVEELEEGEPDGLL